MLKIIIILMLALNNGARIEQTTALFKGKKITYYTAYNSVGGCVCDDVTDLKTLAEILSAPHAIKRDTIQFNIKTAE